MIPEEAPPAIPDAAYWVARMDRGEWNQQDEAALARWLGEDAARHAQLLQTQALWMSLDRQEAQSAQLPLWQRRGVLAAAASLGALMVGGAWRFWPRQQDYNTKIGEIRRVPLNDGSVVMINSGSELAVRMGQSEREVQLTQGEAWFAVAKDPSRPFIVNAGEVQARAVGTAFSVRRHSDSVEVGVTEGVVEAQAQHGQGAPVRLVAGERVLISATSVVYLQSGSAASLDNALAWRNGLINLSGVTLAEAANEFNRYNKVQIYVRDPHIASEQMVGIFRVDDPHGFINAVRATMRIRVDESMRDQIIITSMGNANL
jgi:transmembrane sensor